MKILLIALQLVSVAAVANGQIDRVCQGAYCESIAVRGGIVRFIDSTPPSRTLVLGKYIAADQPLVPSTEAPIRDMRAGRGWRAVISVFLEHSGPNEGIEGLRVRFFDADGVSRGSEDIYGTIGMADLGYLFGGGDEIFAITSTEEHAYNTQTEIWLLPGRGDPKLLLTFAGVYEKFTRAAAGQMPGVRVARETYDGEHAETKGTVQEFWTWNSSARSLSLRPAKE
jgi:hypothetical protein